ncbi:hypothetical protein GCM10029964_121650 [Kibdelosporangium lantanae]
MGIGAWLLAPRWNRLRAKYGDFGQFVIQAVAGIAMFGAVIDYFGGVSRSGRTRARRVLLAHLGDGFLGRQRDRGGITRDMLPRPWKGAARLSEKARLRSARITTFLFLTASMLIAIGTSGTGVVIKIVVAATVGVIGIPLILGLLPWSTSARSGRSGHGTGTTSSTPWSRTGEGRRGEVAKWTVAAVSRTKNFD